MNFETIITQAPVVIERIYEPDTLHQHLLDETSDVHERVCNYDYGHYMLAAAMLMNWPPQSPGLTGITSAERDQWHSVTMRMVAYLTQGNGTTQQTIGAFHRIQRMPSALDS